LTITEKNIVLKGGNIKGAINSSWTVTGGGTFTDRISSGSSQALFQEQQAFFASFSSTAATINWSYGNQYNVLGVYATPKYVRINDTSPVNEDGTAHYCDQSSLMQRP